MTHSGQLDWPAGFERTSPADRASGGKYRVTIPKAFNDLEADLDRIGVEEYRYAFDAPTRKRDGRPYRRANPDDPGFVLRWTMDGDQYAVACDHYDEFRANVRTVGLYLREKRKMEQRPVATGESEFANARLPPGDDETAVVAPAAREPPHEVLGVAEDADPAVVKAAARQLKKKHHPDNGGNRDRFQQIVEAEDELR